MLKIKKMAILAFEVLFIEVVDDWLAVLLLLMGALVSDEEVSKMMSQIEIERLTEQDCQTARMLCCIGCRHMDVLAYVCEHA